MEVLYRVYLGAIAALFVLAFLAGALHEVPADPAAVEDIRLHAPAIFGIAVAVLMLAGLRAGARGGPLAIEAAEVHYTLLAPVSRRTALRPAALSQLRIAVIAGAVFGAVVGNFVFRRFPGRRCRVDRLARRLRRAGPDRGAGRRPARLGAAAADRRRRGDRRGAGRLVGARPGARLEQLADHDARRPGDAAAAAWRRAPGWRRSARCWPWRCSRRGCWGSAGSRWRRRAGAPSWSPRCASRPRSRTCAR